MTTDEGLVMKCIAWRLSTSFNYVLRKQVTGGSSGAASVLQLYMLESYLPLVLEITLIQ